MDSKPKAGAFLQTSLTFESNPYSQAPRNPLTPITFASDRTADQLQMFLLLNSAAGLSAVCIQPTFPDTHHYRSSPRRLPILLITEKLLPNSRMNNCLMTRFKDKHLFLKTKNSITWGGSVGVPVLTVEELTSTGQTTSHQLSGLAPTRHVLPAAHVLSRAWVYPEALIALSAEQLCWMAFKDYA